MSAARLTKRRLAAMETALSAMMAGEPGLGDWPAQVTRADMEAAYEWVTDRMDTTPHQHGAGNREKHGE